MYKKDRQNIADNNPVGPELSNAPDQSPRALMEQQNNDLAQQLLKKQQERIKSGK
jgi:hypothetical protein